MNNPNVHLLCNSLIFFLFMMYVVLTIALCALTTLIYLKLVRTYRRKYEDINRFPGPPPLPILGNLLDLGVTESKIISNLLRLSKKYGPVFRVWLGPTFVSLVVTGPKYIERILVTNSVTNKGTFYKFATEWLGESMPVASGQKWERARKCVAPFFNTINVEKLAPVFNANANKLIENMKALDLKNPVQIEDSIMSCALDNICQTVLSRKCDEQSKTQFWKNFRKQCNILVKRTFSMFIRFDLIFRFTKDYEAQKQCAKSGIKIVEAVVATRKEDRNNEDKPETLLDFLLDCSEYTTKEIHDEISAILSAGSETVTMTLAFCIYELSKHPEIQRKVREEVEAILGGEDLDAEISIENVHKMDYLQCVLKETLRMYTPAPIIERTMTEEIALEDGMRIPRGTSVFIFLLGTHRSEDVYSEPDKFNPDRFLSGNHYGFVPFSAGARNCLGQKYAMIESKIIMSKIIRNFEIIAMGEHQPIMDFKVVLRSKNGLPIILRPRMKIKY